MTRARLLLAVGLLAWALWAVAMVLLFRGEADLRESGTRTVGVVLRVYDEGSGPDADVRFTDQAGHTWEVEVDATDVDDVPETSDEVAIVYAPDDPSRALLADQSKKDRWLTKWVGLPLSIAAAGAIVWLLLYLLKPTRPNGQVAG